MSSPEVTVSSELRISNLSKTYPNGVRALRDVSLAIPTGMFGLLGPNGAGKSTLMRTVATLQEPDSGSITLNGLDVLRRKDEVRKILGYLPQEFGVYPRVSAEAMLDHMAVLKGIVDRGTRKQTVELLLQQTNLHAVRKKKLGTFSGGMKQRFGIAQALLGDPKLIIVDEPTAGLDPEERMRFLNLLSAIGENIVVILSTHIAGKGLGEGHRARAAGRLSGALPRDLDPSGRRQDRGARVRRRAARERLRTSRGRPQRRLFLNASPGRTARGRIASVRRVLGNLPLRAASPPAVAVVLAQRRGLFPAHLRCSHQ
jgi:ABC-type Na+ transport system ATPase subunit NatA